MAGFFGIGDFTKEGKGINKDAPKKRGFFLFFDLFFRKFWKMCKLNMLYALAALPTFIVTFIISGFITQSFISRGIAAVPAITQYAELMDLILRFFVALLFMVFWGMGPVTAGFTYVLRNYSREEHAWMWSDFWQHTKANLKQSVIVWIIDLAAAVFMYIAYTFYSVQTNALFYMRYVIIWIFLFYTMMHFYMYPLMVTFKMSLKDIYKNALLFSMAKLPLNLFVTIVVAVIHVGMPYFGIFGGGMPALYWLVYLLLEFMIFISLSGFVINFSAYQGIKKHMMPPDEEAVTEYEQTDNTEVEQN